MSKRNGQNYQAQYGIDRNGKVRQEKAVNKVGKRLCHGIEMRIQDPDRDVRTVKKV